MAFPGHYHLLVLSLFPDLFPRVFLFWVVNKTTLPLLFPPQHRPPPPPFYFGIWITLGRWTCPNQKTTQTTLSLPPSRIRGLSSVVMLMSLDRFFSGLSSPFCKNFPQPLCIHIPPFFGFFVNGSLFCCFFLPQEHLLLFPKINILLPFFQIFLFWTKIEPIAFYFYFFFPHPSPEVPNLFVRGYALFFSMILGCWGGFPFPFLFEG